MPYEGNVALINGLIPANGQNFPLVHMNHVYVDDEWRLSDVLRDIAFREMEGTIRLTPAEAEIGRTIDSIGVIWNLNQTPERIVINDTHEVEAPRAAGSDTIYDLGITDTTTITFTAYDDGNPVKPASTVTISQDFVFKHRVFWGAASEPASINAAFINSLPSSELRETRAGTITATAGAGEYIWFAYPADFGFSSFDVNGWQGGFIHAKSFNYINPYGHGELYRVYRSARPNIGTVTAIVT